MRSGIRAAGGDLADVVGDELEGGVHEREAGDEHDHVGEQLDDGEGRPRGRSRRRESRCAGRGRRGSRPSRRSPRPSQPRDLAGPWQVDAGEVALGDLSAMTRTRMTNKRAPPTTCSTMPMPCTIERHGSRSGQELRVRLPPRLSVSARRLGLVRNSADDRLVTSSWSVVDRGPSEAHLLGDGGHAPSSVSAHDGWRSVPGGPGHRGADEPTPPRRSGWRRGPPPARA